MIRCYRSLVCLSVFVCLSRSCILLKWQKISTRFLLHRTAPCLSQIALKFVLHRSTPSTNFCHKLIHPSVDFEHRIYSMANCGRLVRDSAMVTYRKPPSLFRMVASLTPTTSPSQKMAISFAPRRTNFRDSFCHLANMIEDIDKIFLHTNDVTFCQTTLVVVIERQSDYIHSPLC